MGMNLKHYSFLLLVFVLASCANRGIGPQGGPKDTVPPHALESNPPLGALEFKGKKIEVTFDEYIEVQDLINNLLMSPPQQNPPEVKARGKKLVVQLQDSLRDSTTYTIDFGNAVVDYREQVPVKGFYFYFSTGPTIDTLEYRGRVFDAMNLNPLKGIFVGIHENMEDSAFVSMPFSRVARTDSAGYFRIGNMREGTYRLYAVDDVSKDYRLTIGEALAFADSTITVVGDTMTIDTLAIDTLITDTLVVDSLIADSLITDSLPMHKPLPALFLFKEEQQKLYLQRTLRDKQHRIQIYFSATPDSLPELRPLADSMNIHIKYSPKRDTVTMWLMDSVSIKHDSLLIEARYRRTDSLYNLEWAVDTLRAFWRAPKLSAKAKEAQDRKNKNLRLDLKSNARRGFEVYDTLRLNCMTPLVSIERDSFHLFERIDTVLKPLPFTMEVNDTLPMEILFLAKFQPEGKYELHVDSGAMHDIYGTTHNKGTYPLQVKALSEYSTLRVNLNPFEPKARIQVMSTKDEVLRELPAVEEGAFFQYLKPDTYYLRLYLDENGDGKWTTGSWTEKRQPEKVYYFPEKIQTKSNWDFEEEWDYTAVEQTASKPKELIKVSSK